MAIPYKAAAVLTLAVLSSACVPWKRERPAYADLCTSKFEFQVPGPQGPTRIFLQAYLYDHAARWSDQPFQQVLHVQHPGEKYPRSEFYVQLIAYNQDRQRVKRGSGGVPAVPILYDSREAFITFADGTRLQARPEVYLGDGDVYDYTRITPRNARPSPYDINSDEVHGLIPRITNNKHYGSAYVVFQTDRFAADSKWTINLGALQVQGQKLPIPPLQLCHQPVKTWIGIEPLMRP
ncbi:hypothetical protein [Pseudomonas cremoricolorata]|uniref:hypothetical protein n=1 Tax=Pseudomonas cremoricolorata TaxID=157783 RepID=UPI000409C7D4|nr:hypothetical protein [Pseudomonas cremoricolorata]